MRNYNILIIYRTILGEMDTSNETLMRQYGETIRNIKIYETAIETHIKEIDVLTRKIIPLKWLNKGDDMFKLYLKKMELIKEYDGFVERLEIYKATQNIQLNIIKDMEYIM